MRKEIRHGRWRRPTAGCCDGVVQGNLVVLAMTLADDFLLFCHRNPEPCPLLEVTDPGQFELRTTARGADLRTDLPLYRIYRHGALEREVPDLLQLWEDDLVGFILGCSFSFEVALHEAGIPIRHVEERRNVPMYVTKRPCVSAGIMAGPLVVSMRPIPANRVARAVEISGRYPLAHGAPVHVGGPQEIGIADLGRPQFGDPVTIRPGEIPVFWACGVTPQAVAAHARLELMITHAPGHMLITDLRHEDLAGLSSRGVPA
jgi:uncharacterized protein YcsI (UPF0317 family)